MKWVATVTNVEKKMYACCDGNTLGKVTFSVKGHRRKKVLKITHDDITPCTSTNER